MGVGDKDGMVNLVMFEFMTAASTFLVLFLQI